MNWNFSEDQNVVCPVCGKTCAGLDWVLDEKDTVTGARVFPCEDVVPIPPYRFGHNGADGALKFTKAE
jgi:hypothetical protein